MLDEADIDVQTQQALENVEAVLQAAETSMADALKVTVYVTDIGDFDVVNDIYDGFFETDPPARSVIEVPALPKGVDIEIEAIATVSE